MSSVLSDVRALSIELRMRLLSPFCSDVDECDLECRNLSFRSSMSGPVVAREAATIAKQGSTADHMHGKAYSSAVVSECYQLVIRSLTGWISSANLEERDKANCTESTTPV